MTTVIPLAARHATAPRRGQAARRPSTTTTTASAPPARGRRVLRQLAAIAAIPWGLAALATTIALTLAPAGEARADDGPRLPADMPKAYRAECASCHTAYPPGMLPRASWARLMQGLDKHYGTDASLDAATVAQLSTWLQAHAAPAREAPPEDRITRSAWFERKHRQIEPATWKLPSVKSAANCAACHAGADQGFYDDDDLRMPAGLSASQRRRWGD